MNKFVAAVEVNRHHEDRLDQINRLTRQLREANARNAKAFDQGAAMVIRALRAGGKLDDIARKIQWELVDGPTVPRVLTEAVPVEFQDSNEHTEPMVLIPFEP